MGSSWGLPADCRISYFHINPYLPHAFKMGLLMSLVVGSASSPISQRSALPMRAAPPRATQLNTLLCLTAPRGPKGGSRLDHLAQSPSCR